MSGSARKGQDSPAATGMLDAVLSTILGGRQRKGQSADTSTLHDDCRALLELAPDGGKRVAQSILAAYAELDEAERLAFFRFLADDLDVDASRVADLAAAYQTDPTARHLDALLHAAEPARQELLRRLNAVPGATSELVAMRSHLLDAMASETPELKRADLDFRHLFSSWFNRGFLELRRISWDSPASVLAKIIAYEAVHEINGWSDLRSRLQPADRRCYAFFHPAIPGEPLVFTEVALVRGTADNVQRVLSEERRELAAEDADTAVFYSISNCQTGLRGISFGNLLIKQVVADLTRELPNLKRVVTLSPLPGFMDWLRENEQDAITDHDRLTGLAAHYLADVKRADGAPRDPVARFHLANGASIHAVHAAADESANGLRQSAGVMVNYAYDLAHVEARQEDHARTGAVAIDRAVKAKAAGAHGKGTK